MKSKTALIVAALSILIVFALAAADKPAKTTGLVKFYNYADGIQKAAADSLHVAVFFETDWCGWCKKMNATTLIDPRVVKLLNEDFVAVRVDGDRERTLTQSFGVKGFPQTWFLTSEGKRIAPAPGFWPADEFYCLLRYIKDDAYEKQQFKEYAVSCKKP